MHGDSMLALKRGEEYVEKSGVGDARRRSKRQITMRRGYVAANDGDEQQEAQSTTSHSLRLYRRYPAVDIVVPGDGSPM